MCLCVLLSDEGSPADHVLEDFEQNKRFLTSLPAAYEIVYPVQLRKNEEQGLSTRDFYGRHKVIEMGCEQS